MAGRRVSIKDVAAHADVSTATVSNVLSGRKPVNSDLQKRVRKAAMELGYSVDRAASQLRSGRTSVIAVLVPDLTDTFFATIVTSIETRASVEGYDVIVSSSRDDPATEASRLNALLAWRPAGIIAVPCSNETPKALAKSQNSLPIVLVDRVDRNLRNIDSVIIDNADAGEIAARHLIEHGHRNIVIASSHNEIAPIAERIAAASRLVVSKTGIAPTVIEVGTVPERGAGIFTRWLERHPIPDAVMATTNVTTLAVLSALARFRIAVPDRTSLVAFDDDTWMSARNTGLTAVRQPVEKIAKAAFERLLFRMNGNGDADPISIVLGASLVVRASVATRTTETKPDGDRAKTPDRYVQSTQEEPAASDKQSLH